MAKCAATKYMSVYKECNAYVYRRHKKGNYVRIAAYSLDELLELMVARGLSLTLKSSNGTPPALPS